MQISQATAGKEPTSGSINVSACPFGSASSHLCYASVMKVIKSSYQNRNYCRTDNYDSCPMFLAKILRGR